jgi:hypothetical protein
MDAHFSIALARVSKAAKPPTSTRPSPTKPPSVSHSAEASRYATQGKEEKVPPPERPPPPPPATAHHQRDPSFYVQYTEEEIAQLAKEVYDGTIADVNLSLLAFWVNEKQKHYEIAKEYIRELGLDKVCSHHLLLSA